ncbi:ImmA/IrrE family metallo-endopeptidase [Cronbergia sp. UHCC 0137]|uniref:ImmA/IrrE family metallo-endopeptidase n=1 Tax=Cronbergia sp. UHCC 0137 TaxID=3110239 RepID=UPI002B1F0F12|nr:ImmA/IrrE family metallo-endopeptidase [Cronbergia sp. UHCC 0137]MEA5619671.1 ImmA/IrrE family metallo-endopeptidase [Cronbergia sp. UHCC 0137]
MTETLTMSYLYAKLSSIGLNQDYVRENGLPSWWNDELNNKHFAVLEGAGYIADNLNLDLKSLLVPEEKIKFNTPPATKFKQHNSQNNDYPYVAQALASRVAELIACGTDVNVTSLPTNVEEIRTEILKNYPKVNLISLLEYCWSKGIVIGYFHHFPKNTKKFAGLIQLQFSRPVIILSSKPTHSARLAFNLAHELGHLALGHLKEGVLILVDEQIEFDCNNDEENQANQFAAQLLLHDCDNCLENKRFQNTDKFSNYVVNEIIVKHPRVEADALILNYGWHNKQYFPLAMSALNKLDPLANGQQIINEYLADRLDWDRFNDENYEYLEKVLGV